MKFKNTGFDFVEFVVKKISNLSPIYRSMGFECVGSRNNTEKGLRSELWQQGFVRILLTEITDAQKAAQTHEAEFLAKQGEGACNIGVEVENAAEAYRETVSRGAKSTEAPYRFENKAGFVERASIFTPSRLRYTFVTRNYPGAEKTFDQPCLFDKDFEISRARSPSPFHLHSIDHLTNNIPMGEIKTWSAFYKDIFQFIVTRSFHIKTGRTGLVSDVVESTCGRIKVPINEATEKESQVQEFVDRMNGAGVQHLALLTTNILDTLPQLRKADFKFLSVPHTYYEAVPTRVPNVRENLKTLEELGILLDGDKSGYLLQIFSQEALGPFFFEYIERKGNRGFGEGNFQALFEAIERDQVRRGTLTEKRV